MTEDLKFKKISVNAAPEEDVVIYAGNSENNVDLSAQADVSVESEIVITDVSDEQFCETQNIDDDAVLVEHVTSANKSKHNDYHETTLEDIEASKMSSMQKAVIIVAVIAVVAFLIWFLG
jgi:hypothetical protein